MLALSQEMVGASNSWLMLALISRMLEEDEMVGVESINQLFGDESINQLFGDESINQLFGALVSLASESQCIYLHVPCPP
jgi:hypothetical protein